MKPMKGCSSCSPSIINGHFCHEQGCPDSWMDENGVDYPIECKECGREFYPHLKYVKFCSSLCENIYQGYEDELTFTLELNDEY